MEEIFELIGNILNRNSAKPTQIQNGGFLSECRANWDEQYIWNDPSTEVGPQAEGKSYISGAGEAEERKRWKDSRRSRRRTAASRRKFQAADNADESNCAALSEL